MSVDSPLIQSTGSEFAGWLKAARKWHDFTMDSGDTRIQRTDWLAL